ncbi:MAG: STAS domain-containing protein [Bacilli bacterium]|nr:STAS domain-containing protein [Bacilli bacterium]
MLHKLENRKLTIYLEGEINSFNSDTIEKEIQSIIASKGFDSIVLDVEKVKYISSAGLRIVSRLKQQYDDLALINMTDDVYDVFEMVGFVDEMEIKKLKK